MTNQDRSDGSVTGLTGLSINHPHARNAKPETLHNPSLRYTSEGVTASGERQRAYRARRKAAAAMTPATADLAAGLIERADEHMRKRKVLLVAYTAVMDTGSLNAARRVIAEWSGPASVRHAAIGLIDSLTQDVPAADSGREAPNKGDRMSTDQGHRTETRIVGDPDAVSYLRVLADALSELHDVYTRRVLTALEPLGEATKAPVREIGTAIARAAGQWIETLDMLTDRKS